MTLDDATSKAPHPQRSKLAIFVLFLGMAGAPIVFVLTYSDFRPPWIGDDIARSIPCVLALVLGPIALIQIKKSAGLLRGIPFALFGMIWAILYLSMLFLRR